MSLPKLDSELLALLSEDKFKREAADRQSPLARENSEGEKTSAQKVRVFITVKENLDRVRSLGFKPELVFGKTAAGEVSLEEIERIAELDDVIQIETPKSHFYSLDTSTKEIKANEIRSLRSGDTWGGIATGRGVIVAIIDSGINYEHRSFRNADGTTRIIRIWDQGLTQGNTPHPDGGTQPNININNGAWEALINYGVEYTRENIRDALAAGGTKLRHVDQVGHGTHVTGVAAGNGFQRDHCRRFYPGVAPEADILVVKLPEGQGEDHILRGIAYAVHIAAQEDKAVVMNLSVHRDTDGAHDGSSNLETGIDHVLENYPGTRNVSLVTIAGNNAAQDTHATASVSPGSTISTDFMITLNNSGKLIDIWYRGENNNSLGCRVRPGFGDETAEVLPGPGGDPARFDMFGGGRIEIFSRPRPNGFQNISIAIIPPPQGLHQQLKENNNWRLELRNLAPGGQPIEFHAWVFYIGTAPTVKFKSNKSKASTVSIPGSARHPITVGSFKEPDTTLLFFHSGGNLSDFSGRGPTIDNRQKPDITAPGEGITAADHDLPGCCRRFWCACCNVFHRNDDGTSIAAPHATGAIALMLELIPDLSRQQVRDFLLNNALKDDFTGPAPSNLWGAGKLNVGAAVKAVNDTLPTPRVFASPPPELAAPPTERLLISDSKLMALQERFMDSPGGRFYYALAEKYVDEIQNLVNGNKKVATVWHRNDGPLMLWLGLRAILKPDDPLPEKINDVSVRERLVRIAQIIKRFANASLVADIDAHLPVLFQMEGKSINQIISFLNSKESW